MVDFAMDLVESLLNLVEYVVVLEPPGPEQTTEEVAKICIVGFLFEA